MEELQKKLLKYLSENARYTAKQLSFMIGDTEENISAEIERLEKEKVILKYTTIINPEKTEEEKVDALIEVKVTPQKLKGFDALAEELTVFDEVESLYLMSGGYDLAILLKGKNLKDIALFVSEKLSAIDGVISCATHFILKKYKVEGQNMTGTGLTERRTEV